MNLDVTLSADADTATEPFYAEFFTRQLFRSVKFTLLTAKPIAWPCSVFTQRQVFSPHTAKSQPIWIKFCTLLLFQLWFDIRLTA